MILRPPRSTPLYSSAASDVYKRQLCRELEVDEAVGQHRREERELDAELLERHLDGAEAAGQRDRKLSAREEPCLRPRHRDERGLRERLGELVLLEQRHHGGEREVG